MSAARFGWLVACVWALQLVVLSRGRLARPLRFTAATGVVAAAAVGVVFVALLAVRGAAA